MRSGGSGSLLVFGEAGIGKSALLEQLVASATDCRVVRAAGAEGEIDLPYAGLHQLCRSLLGSIDALPQPQADALRVAFGLASGEAADRYLVGLAALSLLSEVAAQRPLLCVVDDAHWLDRATTHALAFVARRLGADSVAVARSSRTPIESLETVPVLELAGLTPEDARALLNTALIGQLPEPIRERILVESRGNPLALLELPHTLTPAEMASGLLRNSGGSLSTRIEASFRRRLEPLSVDTRQLLLLVAADPVGDPVVLTAAATHLGLSVEAGGAAIDAGLIEIGERWVFRHPLVRSAAYQSGSARDRRRVHAALAEATQDDADADRQAWHRAQAAVGPDEEIAAALERTAERAMARGGLAVAGAFLKLAARHTLVPAARVDRALAGGEAMIEAGAVDSAERLLRETGTRGMTALQSLRLERLNALVALTRDVEGERLRAVLQLLEIADRLAAHDRALSQASRLKTLQLGLTLGGEFVAALAGSIGAGSVSENPTVIEMVLQGYTELMTNKFPAGFGLLVEAAARLCASADPDEWDLGVVEFLHSVDWTAWDMDRGQILGRRGVDAARRVGALPVLARLLTSWADWRTVAGDFNGARMHLEEADAIAEAVGLPRLDHGSIDALGFDCDEAVRRLEPFPQSRMSPADVNHYRAVAYNGAGRYEQAMDHAMRSCGPDYRDGGGNVVVELVEAAVRCGNRDRAQGAIGHLTTRTRSSGTQWALGLEARCRALLESDEAAQTYYLEAVDRLQRAGARPDLGRAHLLYGEWLRRGGQRKLAREHLRVALELFDTIGMPGFAERARRELLATGETARKRVEETRTDLTIQEAQIARLAAQGATNAEIGAQLFLSPRTVEWHLRHVYPKLGISRRSQLATALPDNLRATASI